MTTLRFQGTGNQQFGFHGDKLHNDHITGLFFGSDSGARGERLFYDFLTGEVVDGTVNYIEGSALGGFQVDWFSNDQVYGLTVQAQYDFVTGSIADTLEQTQMSLLRHSDDLIDGSNDGGSLRIRTLGGDDTVWIESGNSNWINGNWGNDTISVFGGDGIFRGGRGDDGINNHSTSSVFVNGNQGNDQIRSFVISSSDAVFRGGKGDDTLYIFNGNVYGDDGSDTFVTSWKRGVYATIKDFSKQEDKIRDNTGIAFFRQTSEGLMYSEWLTSNRTELVNHYLLEGIYDSSGISVISA